MRQRQKLGLITVGALLALAVLVSLVQVGGVIGVALFLVVLFLVGIVFFRFGPHGDAWDQAQQLGVSPWLYVVVILALGIAVALLRHALHSLS